MHFFSYLLRTPKLLLFYLLQNYIYIHIYMYMQFLTQITLRAINICSLIEWVDVHIDYNAQRFCL